MISKRQLIIIIAFLILISLSFQPAIHVNGQNQNEYVVEVAFPNLAFNQPDAIVAEPQGNRLFVLEQGGLIKVFDNNPNVTVAEVFLDIRDKVLFSGEQGLLGLAFHPNFDENGFFYLDYVTDNPRRTVISRFKASADLNLADRGSEQILLEIAQPYSNHKGGQIVFGPDGYLYVAMGDGGSAGDPQGNGQSLSTLLGKILRIDVDSSTNGRNYGIPNANPFVGNGLGYREEIYAYGFRNPWRFSFDVETGRLWVGDVGQARLEEIDIVEKGKNYGWGVMEGSLCYNPQSDCDRTGLELPVWNYSREMGYSVIGGYVYRGALAASLSGAYVYGDYGSGRIWALRLSQTGPSNILLAQTGLNIASFGVDQKNELYFTAYDGKIYKLALVIPEFPSASWALLVPITIAMLLLVSRKFRQPRVK